MWLKASSTGEEYLADRPARNRSYYAYCVLINFYLKCHKSITPRIDGFVHHLDIFIFDCICTFCKLLKQLARHRLGCFCTHHSLGGGSDPTPPAISKTDERRETDEAAFERSRRDASKPLSKI